MSCQHGQSKYIAMRFCSFNQKQYFESTMVNFIWVQKKSTEQKVKDSKHAGQEPQTEMTKLPTLFKI